MANDTIAKKQTPAGGPPSPVVTLGVNEALQFGIELHKAGALAASEALYRRILETVPENIDALHFLGFICFQEGRYSEAAELIGRVIEIDPLNSDAHNNLGNLMKSLEQHERAEECYRKALELRPGNASAHNNLGVVMAAKGQFSEAVEAYRRAIELSPDSADFHYNLGNAFRKLSEPGEAAEAYRKAIALDGYHIGARKGLVKSLLQDDRRKEAEAVLDEWLDFSQGSSDVIFLKAAYLGRDAPTRAPDAYVQHTFDELSVSFDSHLKDNLDYRAPDLLIDALAGVLPKPAANLEILDAGCGTGLCGELLRTYAGRLTGVDLSSGMLKLAAERNVYDRLIESELCSFMAGQTEAFDVIASADTLCYFGTLEQVFEAAAKALKNNGTFGFTLEAAKETVQKWHLNSNCRYVHSKRYIEEALAAAGLTLLSLSSVVLRKEAGEPVAGHLVTARKMAAI